MQRGIPEKPLTPAAGDGSDAGEFSSTKAVAGYVIGARNPITE